ncbi:MAG: hypothetical protein ACHQ17_11885 [Polyangia bacterium]|jgi:hypothetical protein
MKNCVLALALLTSAGVAQAMPPFPMPKLSGVLKGDMVAKARIRFSKMVEGKRVTLTIQGGEATRLNPNWSPQPARLPYDLDKNRTLAQAIKSAHLGAQVRYGSDDPDDRTLEILAEGPKDYVVVGTWVMPAKKWQKRHRALYELLEPLFSAQVDVFQTMGGQER